MNIEEVMKDEAFVAQLKAAESLDEIAELCKAKGIDVTVEQLEETMKPAEDELGEADLDTISGGGWLMNWWRNWISGNDLNDAVKKIDAYHRK